MKSNESYSHVRTFRVWRSVVILAICILSLLPAVSFAVGKGTGKAIAQVERFIAEAEFESALEIVNSELEKENLPATTQGRLYELQGTLFLYLDNEGDALAAFQKMLEVDPGHQFREDASPKVKSIYEEAKVLLAEKISKNLKLRHPRPRSVRPGEAAVVELKMQAPPSGVKAELFYRRSSGGGFSSTLFVEGDDHLVWTAIVPDLKLAPETSEDGTQNKNALEYYIEVHGPGNALLAIAGKADAPLAVPYVVATNGSEAEEAAVDSSSPWYTKWWVWTIAGVVVAGAVTGGVIYAMSDQTGTVPVNVTVH